MHRHTYRWCVFLSISVSASLSSLSQCGCAEGKQITAILNSLSLDQKTNGLPRDSQLQSGHSVPYSGVKKTESPSSAAQNISAGELVGLVTPSTHGRRSLLLWCDRWTSGLGHGHSLWQITRSQLRLAARVEDPCWGRVLCNPSLTCLASTLPPIIPLSPLYVTHPMELPPAEK